MSIQKQLRAAAECRDALFHYVGERGVAVALQAEDVQKALAEVAPREIYESEDLADAWGELGATLYNALQPLQMMSYEPMSAEDVPVRALKMRTLALDRAADARGIKEPFVQITIGGAIHTFGFSAERELRHLTDLGYTLKPGAQPRDCVHVNFGELGRITKRDFYCVAVHYDGGRVDVYGPEAPKLSDRADKRNRTEGLYVLISPRGT